MKNSIWDILTGVVLLVMLCTLVGFGAILMNPEVGFNPLRPSSARAADLVPTISIPTPTETVYVEPTETPVGAQETPDPNAGGGVGTDPGGAPTLRPSSTPVPTETPFSLPTFTRAAPARATSAGASGGQCQVVSQTPPDGTTMSPGTSFTTRWTVRNTRSDAWRADAVDLRFVSGDKLHTGPDVYDLNTDIANNATLDILIAMQAPGSSGTYTSNWGLYEGDRSICRFYIQVKAKN